jgi:hypothetical protein
VCMCGGCQSRDACPPEAMLVTEESERPLLLLQWTHQVCLCSHDSSQGAHQAGASLHAAQTAVPCSRGGPHSIGRGRGVRRS